MKRLVQKHRLINKNAQHTEITAVFLPLSDSPPAKNGALTNAPLCKTIRRVMMEHIKKMEAS